LHPSRFSNLRSLEFPYTEIQKRSPPNNRTYHTNPTDDSTPRKENTKEQKPTQIIIALQDRNFILTYFHLPPACPPNSPNSKTTHLIIGHDTKTPLIKQNSHEKKTKRKKQKSPKKPFHIEISSSPRCNYAIIGHARRNPLMKQHSERGKTNKPSTQDRNPHLIAIFAFLTHVHRIPQTQTIHLKSGHDTKTPPMKQHCTPRENNPKIPSTSKHLHPHLIAMIYTFLTHVHRISHTRKKKKRGEPKFQLTPYQIKNPKKKKKKPRDKTAVREKPSKKPSRSKSSPHSSQTWTHICFPLHSTPSLRKSHRKAQLEIGAANANR
jgi:hypothetical protein